MDGKINEITMRVVNSVIMSILPTTVPSRFPKKACKVATKFTFFPRLPKELQLRVWEEACIYVTVVELELQLKTSSKDYDEKIDRMACFIDTGATPMLHSCHDSRTVALKKGHFRFRDEMAIYTKTWSWKYNSYRSFLSTRQNEKRFLVRWKALVNALLYNAMPHMSPSHLLYRHFLIDSSEFEDQDEPRSPREKMCKLAGTAPGTCGAVDRFDRMLLVRRNNTSTLHGYLGTEVRDMQKLYLGHSGLPFYTKLDRGHWAIPAIEIMTPCMFRKRLDGGKKEVDPQCVDVSELRRCAAHPTRKPAV